MGMAIVAKEDMNDHSKHKCLPCRPDYEAYDYSDWCVPVNMCSAGTECSFREKMHLYFTKLYDKNNYINTAQPHDAYSTCNWIRNENLNTEKPMLYFILTLIILVITLIVYLMWSEGEPALYLKQFKPSKVKISAENSEVSKSTILYGKTINLWLNFIQQNSSA